MMYVWVMYVMYIKYRYKRYIYRGWYLFIYRYRVKPVNVSCVHTCKMI